MSSDLLSVIGHYQRSIERSASDEARLLHCIDKLYRLPVTVEHLQATGVGKTVNSLRKYDKEVGIAAKALVAKWKAMVAAEEDDEPEQEEQNYNRRRSQGDDSVHDNSNHQHAATTTTRTDSNRNISQNHSRHNGHSSHTQSRDRMEQKINERRSEKERLESEARSKSNKRSSSSSSHRSNYEESKYENDKGSRTEHEDRRRDDTSKRLKGNDIKLPALPENLNIDDESGEDDDEEKLIIDVTKEMKVKLDDSKRKRESLSPSKHNHHKNNDHHSPKDNKEKKDKHKEKDKDKHRKSEKRHKDESSSERNKRKEKDNKDHNSKHKDYDSHRSKHKEKKQEKEKDESSSSHRSNGEHRHKNKEKDKKRKDAEENKPEEIKKEKHKRRNSDSDSKLSDVSPPKPKVPKVLVDGIDSSMGTSFEDALGMMFSPSKKSRSPKASTSSSSTTSTTFVKPAASSKPVKESKQTPALLSSAVKLEPLDPTLMLDIPTISPNYKPMPLNPTVMDCVFSPSNKIAAPPPPRRMLTDEEAMSVGISSKTMRTKVYSGIKTGALLQVTSLFDLCIRVLQKNIDALEYTGGVPFEVLRPVLERANPQQLVNFEEFNPYLMEDSDILWQQHCIRYYRGKKRVEMETWREMFMRCKEEQDLKLSLLAENIKQSQKQIALPVRKTQLAYVDSMVKPPRNVQRKQEQYGTKGKLAATPAARVAALSGITPNVAKAGDNRLKIVSNERDTAQATSHSRPKKAPLMQKTLQFMKGRFKR